MKFKFCSDGDCPLWALAGLNAVSTLPAAVFKKILDVLIEEQSDDDIMELLKDTNMCSRNDAARIAGVIRWTLKSTWRTKCEGSQLTRDLLVLGVPRAHATALADAADNGREKYEQNVKENPFMINRVTGVSVSPAPENAIDSITLKLQTDNVFTGIQKQNEIIINKTQVPVLLDELKKAYTKLDDLGID